ncbi:MAG: Mth938-like domain-containing protein [Gammaproteobacteria bacterium]|nr:Mth938-like domain-containing protein [Gammaproteobacteria bacterium]
MEFTQQDANYNSIVSHNQSAVTLAHTEIKKPCFISPRNTKELSIHSLDEVDKELIFQLTCQEPLDLLIIGTGEKVAFLPAKQQVALGELGLGVECMNNTSACSSFNLLLSDARAVGLLIL